MEGDLYMYFDIFDEVKMDEIHEGFVFEERVSDYGDSNDFALCVDGNDIINIFYKYKGKKIKLFIKVLE